MDCKHAQNMIRGYIDNTLTDYELQCFLEHIRSCPECYDELEVFYTVITGVRRLDDDNASYDLRGTMQRSLAESEQYIRRLTFLKTIRYACTTLSVYGVAVALFLQFRIWLLP